MNDTIFLPVKNTKCPSGWKFTNYIGEGSNARTYQTCCKKRCNYVAKIMQNVDIDRWENEILIQNKAAEIDVSIPVIDHFHNSQGYFIIMKALQSTIYNIFFNINENNDITDDEKILLLYNYYIKIKDKLYKMMKNGIQHNDIKLDNIMVDNDDNVYFIDFGSSTYEKIDESEFESEFEYSIEDITRQISMVISDELYEKIRKNDS
jgi:tRNA A-37 threonylcarbamoyl transferase component Bud32